jgi:hypothetical protein
MKFYLEKNNLQYFTFSTHSEKPIKAVICLLPPDMPTKDISNSLEDLGFNIINMRQMMANRASNGQTHIETLPLFLATLPRNVKSQETFKLNSLKHIIILVKSYKAQTGLMQCYNCQIFGHVWANCMQPL